jgi:hypothetical protein
MTSAMRANSQQFAKRVSTGPDERVVVMDSDRTLIEQVNQMWKKLQILETKNRQLEANVFLLQTTGAPGSGAPSR